MKRLGWVFCMAAVILCAGSARAQVASLTLDWTATGDDGNVGTAAAYDLRYSTARPDTTTQATFTTWWNAATVATGLPTPAVAGTAQSVTVTPTGGFLPGTTYYFVFRARDEAGNWSPFSNVAFRAVLDSTSPARVGDLRVR